MLYACDCMDMHILSSWAVDANTGGAAETTWVGFKGMISDSLLNLPREGLFGFFNARLKLACFGWEKGASASQAMPHCCPEVMWSVTNQPLHGLRSHFSPLIMRARIHHLLPTLMYWVTGPRWDAFPSVPPRMSWNTVCCFDEKGCPFSCPLPPDKLLLILQLSIQCDLLCEVSQFLLVDTGFAPSVFLGTSSYLCKDIVCGIFMSACVSHD